MTEEKKDIGPLVAELARALTDVVEGKPWRNVSVALLTLSITIAKFEKMSIDDFVFQVSSLYANKDVDRIADLMGLEEKKS